jgi:hypothetical protein
MKKGVALIAMLLGGMLYITGRSESLRMFAWLGSIGARDEIQDLRSFAAPYIIFLPRWVFYSLPQALWYLSGLLSFDCIWGLGTHARRACRVWSLAFSVIAFGSEIGQYFRWAPGRFDPLDLTLLVASLIAVMATGVLEHRNGQTQRRGSII